MKKPLLWVLVLAMSISLVSVFGLGGCRPTVPPVEEEPIVEEPVVEEVTDEPEEEALDGSKIAFASWRQGNSEIYIMNVDGSRQTRLTNNLEEDSWPSFSPDGSKIAFSSNRDGSVGIYIMNVDGSGQTRLTNAPAGDGFPSFSR